MKRVFKFAMPFLQASLVKQILIALILGVGFAYLAPGAAESAGFLGKVFVTALKAVAPVLVFVLVMSSIANQDLGSEDVHMKPILAMYLIATFLSALVAVAASFLFPTELILAAKPDVAAAPSYVSDVLGNVVLNVVDNPVHAIANGNYIGILAWAIAMGMVLRHSGDATREVLSDVAKGVEFVVRLVIRFAPVGIFGLVSQTFATTGVQVFQSYLELLAVLMGSFLVVALIVNPLMVAVMTHKNPFPLVWMTLRESGVNAFFTRSSAANIPVNLEICRRLGLPESTYSISIPVGGAINMGGAAITITVLTLSAAYTLGIHPDLGTAVLLSFVASICACGASGVPGGSLMLIPLACGLFGIDQGTALQVVAVGFIIGVLQDSAETALNSSSDALFTIAACQRAERLGK